MNQVVEHSKLIGTKLKMQGIAFLRQSNFSHTIAFSCFDDKKFCEGKNTVAIFSIKTKVEVRL